MPRRIWNSIKSVTVVAALVVSADGFDVRANTAYANECLAAQNASPPQGQHWYYRIERPNHRKCWYLRAPATMAGAHRLVTERWEAPHPVKAARNTGSNDPSGGLRPDPHGHDGVMNDQEKEALFQEFSAWQKAHRLDADANQ